MVVAKSVMAALRKHIDNMLEGYPHLYTQMDECMPVATQTIKIKSIKWMYQSIGFCYFTNTEADEVMVQCSKHTTYHELSDHNFWPKFEEAVRKVIELSECYH